MNRKKIYFPLIFAFLLSMLLSFKVCAKEISISSLDVNSKLLKDGSLYIEEIIDFKIDGDFNGVYREINTKFSSGIENIEVSELSTSGERKFEKVESAQNGQDGVYQILKTGDVYNVKIYSPSKNTNKKFKLIYKLNNVAVKYNDIGELHYRFWGDKSKTTIDKFNIKLTMEESTSASDLRILPVEYTRNMEAKVIGDNTFSINGEKVKIETPIEVKFFFPKESIDLSKNVVKEYMLKKIQEEERSYQKSIDDAKKHRENMNYAGSIIGIIIFVVNLFLGFFIFKSTRIEMESLSYNSFPEDCTPAIAGKLFKNSITERSVIATILDLVRKEYLNIKKIDNDDYMMVKKKNADEYLLSHEKYIIKWFIDYIGDGAKVKLKDIEEYSKESRDKFFEYFYSWKMKVKEEFNKKGYYDKNTIKLARRFISISFIEILLMIIFLSYSIAASLAAMITGGFILIYSFSLYRRKTQYGESQFRMWKNFKDYLENESFVKYEELKSMDNIDKHLVYAIALGVNNKVFEKLNINIDTKSNSEDDYYDSCLYWYFYLDMDSSDNKIQNSLYNHSNANDDGGFSSGDGGGCAGGGDAGGF